MVQYVSFCAQSFFSIPLQSFSEKLSTAIGIARAMDDFPKLDLERLEFILENTSKDYYVPLAVLDLYVDPSKGIDVTEYERLISVKSTFLKEKDNDEEFKKFKMSRYTIQKILFDAVTECMGIMNKYFMKYNEEIDFSGIGESSSKKVLFER